MDYACMPRQAGRGDTTGPALLTFRLRVHLAFSRDARRCFGPGPMLPGPLPRPVGRHTRIRAIEHSPDIASSGLQAAVLAYRAELNRFLVARRATPDEAEDILQDLYVNVRSLRIAPVAEPRAYLYRMTANLLADRRRSAARRVVRELAWMDVQLNPEQEVDERPSAEQEVG